MVHFLTTLISTGIEHEMPEYLKNRVKPTNLICLLLVLILSLPFTLISLIHFPGMTIFPAVAGGVAILVMIANRMGLIYYSRLVLPVVLLSLSSLCNAYFSTSMADSVNSIYLIELSFTLIPFLVFDFREKAFLVISTVFSVFVLIIFPETWGYFDMGYDGTVLREGPLAVLTVLLATIFQLGCIGGLAVLNQQSAIRFNQLLQTMNEKNTEIEVSRKELEDNLEQLQKARIEESNRQWVAEGISRLSAIIRINLQNDQVYDKILSALIRYIEANQGGLYLIDQATHSGEAHDLIKLTACYAYDRKKYINKSFQAGEGLIGQVYLEGEYVYLTDIPATYINITSGLGGATPTALLIMPLKVNDTTEAILEIASFHLFAPHQIEFLLKAGESIASFIQTNRINLRTRSLLAESQLQADIMRAQEEEMRQNMEELQALQEEAARRQEEAADLLERFNLAAETTTEGLWDMTVPADLVIKDETPFWWAARFRHMLGYNDERDFPNRLNSWANLLHPDHKAATLAAFSAHLLDYSGRTPYDVEYQLKLKNGDYKWFRAVGKTLRSENGKPLRVAGTLIDIQMMKDLHNFQRELEEKVKGRTLEIEEMLKISQKQAEYLKLQEAEMLQNMEELSATQEELNLRERKYLQHIAELKTANSRLQQ